jgi:cation diffusion facilitator family transporter
MYGGPGRHNARMSDTANSLKSVLFALAANAAIAVTKTVGAAFTGSSSMMAEAIHSWADCANQGLLLWGMKHSRRPATPDHPLGHGRAIYFWSFIVALLLFSLGGLFSLYEGLHKLHDPQPLDHAWLALAILGFGVVAEGMSLWGAMREVEKIRGGQSLWQWFRHTRKSELVVVVGEDMAALGGLALAFAAIGLTLLTGNPVFDALGSIAVGMLLVAVALAVAREIAALLVGQSVHPQISAAMRAHLQAREEVAEVYNLITQQLGDDVMIAVKARMQPQGDETRLIQAINRVEASLREAFPQLRWVFFEPDLAD